MIQTAAIIWAVLATVLGIASAVITERTIREARRLTRTLDDAECAAWTWELRAQVAEIELSRAARQRSETTRRGNLTRSAKRRAAVASPTEQIRKEIGR